MSLGLNELSNGWPSTSKLHCWWPLSMVSQDYHRSVWIESLALGRCGNNFECVISEHLIKFMRTSCDIALRWMTQQNPTDDKSTLVQVMAWCRQTRSNCLSQCRPRSISLYGITRPQCVNSSLFAKTCIGKSNNGLKNGLSFIWSQYIIKISNFSRSCV